MNAGFTDQERRSFSRLLGSGFIDSFRHLHPDDADQYSWWSFAANARERNIGWRLDYVMASEALAAKATACVVQKEVGTSDHAPVVATFA